MHIYTVIGARPQFVKAAVLSRYIRNNPSLGVKETLIHTGQHYDANMSEVFFSEMGIPKPDVNLQLGSGSHGAMTGQMIIEIEKLLLNGKPDLLLVYGDTNSTLAGALAASKLGVPVAHIEAGLRSYMMSMPEEQNRRMTDHLSSWLFCPTENAVNNLLKEGIVNTEQLLPNADHKRVATTGDIMYEASLYYRGINEFKTTENEFVLLTIHRQENTDDIKRLNNIINAINQINKNVIFPIHPRTRKIIEQNNISLSANIKMIDPIGYFEMLAYESACDYIITDSGGVQKEAYFFQKPCITLRDNTEWVELVDAGWNTLVGADQAKILTATKNIEKPDTYTEIYGTGNTAQQIMDVLKG